MENLPSSTTIVFTILLSIFSSYLFFKLLQWRAHRIKSAILELEQEELFLERLSKGNIVLIRTGFALLFMCLGLALLASMLLIIPHLMSVSPKVKLCFQYFAMTLMLIGAFLCFYFCRSIARLRDLKAAKNLLNIKKNRLQKKLSAN